MVTLGQMSPGHLDTNSITNTTMCCRRILPTYILCTNRPADVQTSDTVLQGEHKKYSPRDFC